MKNTMLTVMMFVIMITGILLGYYAGLREGEHKTVPTKLQFTSPLSANLKVYGVYVGRCQLIYDSIEISELAQQLKID